MYICPVWIFFFPLIKILFNFNLYFIHKVFSQTNIAFIWSCNKRHVYLQKNCECVILTLWMRWIHVKLFSNKIESIYKFYFNRKCLRKKYLRKIWVCNTNVKSVYSFLEIKIKIIVRGREQYFLTFLFLAVAIIFVEFSIIMRKSLNIVLLRRKRTLYMGFTVLLSLYQLGRAAQCDPRKIKSFGSWQWALCLFPTDLL